MFRFSRTCRTAIAIAIGFACLAGFTAYGERADDQELTEEQEREFPEVPEPVLARFMSAVRASSTYRVAQSMRADVRVPLLQEWERELSVQLVPSVESFMEHAMDIEYREPSGTVFSLSTDAVEHQAGYEVTLFVISVSDGENERRYRVPPDWIRDLNFDVLESVRLLHPLNRRLRHFEVRGQTLTEVATNLAREAGVDYVFREDTARDIWVTQSVHEHTVFESLCFAAWAGGWTVRVRRQAGRDEDISVWEHRKLDSSVHMNEVTELYVNRGFRNLMERIDPPVSSPEEAFRHVLFRAAQNVAERRIVVVLEPQ